MSIIKIDFKKKKPPKNTKRTIMVKRHKHICVANNKVYPDHSFDIDLSTLKVSCLRCKIQLNPWLALEAMAHDDAQFVKNIEECDRLLKLLDERTRYKCKHCNKFNNIKP